MKDGLADFSRIDGEIRRAKMVEHDASQEYYQHIDTHGPD
jgi:hypothetical protein